MSQLGNTLTVGKVLIPLDNCDSTNTFAKELIAKNKPIEGTVVFAANQTQGRGQIGNSWSSEPNKNLTLSIALFPTFLKADEQFFLSKIVSIALADLLKRHLKREVNIKWPNDIYCEGKKLAGILIENQLQGTSISQSVLGVGLNVNQTSFPDLPSAGSLKSFLAKDLYLEELMHELFQELDALYLKLRIGKKNEISLLYNELMLGLGETLRFKDSNGSFNARVKGVNIAGQLILEVADKGDKLYNFKEVSWVFN